MEHDFFEVGIGIMTVLAPTSGREIDFDIADDWGSIAEAEDGLEEVWAGAVVPEPGMEYLERGAVEAAEFATAQPLAGPDLLELFFLGPAVGFLHLGRSGRENAQRIVIERV